MNLIVCLDDKDGMLFNRRRQSRDAKLCERVAALAAGHRLWMNAYSAPLFDAVSADIVVDEAFLEKAGEDDYCFVENTDITPYRERLNTVVVYRWNRVYPSDTVFDRACLHGASPIRTEDFVGNSHEKITEVIYRV